MVRGPGSAEAAGGATLDGLLRALGEASGGHISAQLRQLLDALRARLNSTEQHMRRLYEENRALREAGATASSAAGSGVSEREFLALQRQLTETTAQFTLLKARAHATACKPSSVHACS